MKIISYFLMTTILICTGCASTRPDSLNASDVQRVWSEIFNPYQITPLFPLGGAAQPGDIYQVCIATNTDKSQSISKQQTIGNIDLSDELKKYYQSRLNYNFTSNKSITEKSPKNIYDKENTLIRPIPILFPDLSIAYQHSTNGGLSFPIGITESKIGYNSAKYHYYSVHLDGATAMVIPDSSITKKLATLTSKDIAEDKSYCQSPDSSEIIVLGTTYSAKTIIVGEGDGKSSSMQAMLSVLLGTGTQATTSAALGAAALPAAAAATTTTPSIITGNNPIVITSGSAASAIPSSTNPGLSIGTSTSSGYSIGTKLTDSEFPIAFGAKVYLLDVSDKKTTIKISDPPGVVLKPASKPLTMQ